MKLFCGDHLIEIVLPADVQPTRASVTATFPASLQQFKILYNILISHKRAQREHFLLLSPNPEAFFQELLIQFEIVQAAGGILQHQGKLLFIYRLGKWDLPKGKVEAGEAYDEAALREVEEECGISASLQQKIGETWHTYIRSGKHYIKCSHWYAMARQDERELKPQTEEGIEKVVFWDSEEIQSIVIPNTYASISEILQLFLKKNPLTAP